MLSIRKGRYEGFDPTKGQKIWSTSIEDSHNPWKDIDFHLFFLLLKFSNHPSLLDPLPMEKFCIDYTALLFYCKPSFSLGKKCTIIWEFYHLQEVQTFQWQITSEKGGLLIGKCCCLLIFSLSLSLFLSCSLSLKISQVLLKMFTILILENYVIL